MNEPFADVCTNPGQENRWTTPCCYHDVEEPISNCPKCGRAVTCTVEQQPITVCCLVEPEDDLK